MNQTPATEETARRAPQPAAPPPIRPAVDVYETETGYVLLADMPGVTVDGLEVHVEEGQLTLRGRPTPTTERPTHREFTLREYQRTFNLADELDTANITARFQDGVLRLEIPKAARAKVRKIPVQVS